MFLVFWITANLIGVRWPTFPWRLMMYSIFSFSFWPSVSFIGEMFIQIFIQINIFIQIFWLDFFFFWLLSCMSSLYMLDISLLSDMIHKYFLSFSRLFFYWWFPLLCRSSLVWCSPTYLPLLLLLLFGCQI